MEAYRPTINEVLLYFVIRYEADWKKIYRRISEKERINVGDLLEMKKNLTCSYVTIIDKEYPEALRNLRYPPYILFYKGDLTLLKVRDRLAVVGSRAATAYGIKMCDKLTRDLVKRNYLIVSGLAKGIDGEAHKVALDEKGKTIAVLGGGFNKLYPPENSDLYRRIIEEGGLVISEYPEDTSSRADRFPARNRIIAALANRGVLVVEARKRSGTLLTVGEALYLGRDVYCVPNRADCESSCNTLIQEGARLVVAASDIGDD